MKKLLATFIFIILYVLSYSQTLMKFTSYAAVRGEYSKEQKKFVYKNPVFEENEINIFDKFISINDRVGSIYTIIDDAPLISREIIYSVNCKDQDNRKCIVSIMKLEDNSLHCVVVNPLIVTFIYHLNNKQ